jgi:hypothetical protein
MREYIDIVRRLNEGEVIAFPGPANLERSRVALFTPDSHFTLVISKGVDVPQSEQHPGGRSRSLVLKVHDLTMNGLMRYFKTYAAKPMPPDEMRYWKSRESENDEGHRVVYDLHVFLNDHSALSLEQFGFINKMIQNGYEVPITLQKNIAS